MGYSLKWYIENEIVYARYFGATTGEEMRSCLIETKDYIERSPRQLVHIIMDVGDITAHVPLKDSMRIVREVGPHDRVGWTIIVREKSPIIKMASSMGASLFQLRLKSFDTMEEAINHLRFFDTTLSWDKADEFTLQP